MTQTVTVRTTIISKVPTTITTTVKTTITAASTRTTTAGTTTQATTAATAVSYTISEAVAQGIVQVKANGYAGTSFGGVSSGDVIKISFLRQRAETIRIVVPLGTTLISDDSSRQNMVIMKLKGRDPSVLGYYPVSEIVLNQDDWQNFLFEAYCMNISKSNIMSSTTFSIGNTASHDIKAMLSAAQTLGTEIATISAIQTALWVLTDNPSFDDLSERFAVDDKTMNGAWTILDEAGLNPGSKNLFIGYSPG
jgi:hypothetical protein